MDTLRTALFEQPIYLYAALCLCELVIIASWRRRPSRAMRLALAGPVVLAGLLFLVEKLVVTDREQITRALADMAGSVVTGPGKPAGLDGIAGWMDDQCRVDLGDQAQQIGLTRAQAIQAGRQLLERMTIRSIRLMGLRVEPSGNAATSHFTSLIQYKTEGEEGTTSVIWRLSWIRRQGRWRILAVEAPQTGVRF